MTGKSWGIISRLVDMGIPAYMVANTLNLAVAQRLVRLLCPVCKSSQPFDSTLLPASFRPVSMPDVHYTPVGCDQCFYTGYRGRQAIYEVLYIDETLKEGIKHAGDSIPESLNNSSIRLLKDQAWSLITTGVTSIEEGFSLLFHT